MEEKSHKTVVAFVAGLLIGGLLVWAFGSSSSEEENPNLDTAQKKIENVAPQSATANDEGSTETVASAPLGDKGGRATPMMVAAGSGSIVVENQSAGSGVALSALTVPVQDAWIAVHELRNGELANILGAVRYNSTEGLAPTRVELLRDTVVGQTYSVVIYGGNGDRVFELGDDTPLVTPDGSFIQDTFTAQ